ncbi:MAG: response regulator transcription factor [Anaerolineae bacterium]|nr:response regulator transcription factor [Anaerolineae bacterium]
MSGERIGVLVVDDHTLFRHGVRQMIEVEDDMHVLGEAASGRQALAQARELMPDVILMDIQMPDPKAGPGQALDGIEAARILHREMPHVGILFCTMYEDDEFVFAGLKAGGQGYILKESDPETMLRAIRAVAHGESLLSPTVARKVLQQFAALPGELPPGASSLCDDLTDREVEVLSLVGEGLANKEIARQLGISEKTVKNHVGNIFSKLHVCDRTQAVLYAIRQGLVKV